MNPIVSIRDLRRSFATPAGPVEVLRGIDLDLLPGELTFLTGPSGCGKTTLLTAVAGLLRPSSGSVTVLGHDLAAMASAQAARIRLRQIGFAFQQYHLLAALSAIDNVAIPLLAAGAPAADARSAAARLLDRLGMHGHHGARPRQLSGGQQQRVAMARALVHDPRMVLCDEPTAALDHRAGDAVMELLRAVAIAPDRSVLVVTHDARMHRYADRILAMEDGRIVADHRNRPAPGAA